MGVTFPLVVVIAILTAAFFVVHGEATRRARFLRRAGFTLMAISTLFFGTLVIGEAVTDPGGWQAVGMIAVWAVPFVALVAITWTRPDWATRLFAVVIAAVIGMSLWFAVNPEGWRTFEDRNGPIRTIVVFVVAAVVTLLGLKRTAVAGVMLLLLGSVPILVSSLGSHLGFTSLAVASSPPVITGVLYVASALLSARSSPPGSAEGPSEEQPKAA